MQAERTPVITGIGLVSALGDGAAAHWAALNAEGPFRPVVEADRFAPYPIHPMAPLDLDRQIPKRDQRQMEPWQRIGVYAAGLALEQAGVKGEAALLDRTHLIVAAGGGERDTALDETLFAALASAPEPDGLVGEQLMAGLRPTLFLAQLTNLLAGSISIVHGVVGSSRTFMGEEAAGADALRIACARIAACDGDLFLVGGSQNVERPEMLLAYEMGGMLLKGPYAPVWARQEAGGGIVLGSVGCFLVIEALAHAMARGARPIAALPAIAADRSLRTRGAATANAARQLETMRPLLDLPHVAVISAASGGSAATAEERAFLEALDLPFRAAATALGSSGEPGFPAAVALAALAVQSGTLFAPLEAAERPMRAPLRQALVTGWGHWRGEAMALVTAAA
ncbi:MAG TPA: beta-ketoacyl-ACP synthase [Acetobacteraceae bacterium]|nr:beta-ketoacyl-ACP synthase [Acetobacteraceae bacterium]